MSVKFSKKVTTKPGQAFEGVRVDNPLSEWKDMPEFISANKHPAHTVYVHFRNIEDIKKFSVLIGQKLSTNSKRNVGSIWYPKKDIIHVADKRYAE